MPAGRRMRGIFGGLEVLLRPLTEALGADGGAGGPEPDGDDNRILALLAQRSEQVGQADTPQEVQPDGGGRREQKTDPKRAQDAGEALGPSATVLTSRGLFGGVSVGIGWGLGGRRHGVGVLCCGRSGVTWW